MLANEVIDKYSDNQFFTKSMQMQAGYVDDWHSHPWHQVIFPVSGLLQSEIGANNFIVPHNGLLFIPANKIHKSVAITNTQFLSLYLDPACKVTYPKNEKSCSVTPFLKSLLLLLLDQDSNTLTAQVTTNLLIVLRDQINSAENYNIPLLMPKDRRLLSVFLQLQSHPDLKLTLVQWASKVGASPRTLSRLCVNEFNLSFSLWRKNIRLVLSLQLLERNRSIREIAMDLGYQSDSAYIYAFKGVFGQTPSKYRRSNLL